MSERMSCLDVPHRRQCGRAKPAFSAPLCRPGRDYKAFTEKARAEGKTVEEARAAASQVGLRRFDYSGAWKRPDPYVRLGLFNYKDLRALYAPPPFPPLRLLCFLL
jgi:hypothetical protein